MGRKVNLETEVLTKLTVSVVPLLNYYYHLQFQMRIWKRIGSENKLKNCNISCNLPTTYMSIHILKLRRHICGMIILMFTDFWLRFITHPAPRSTKYFGSYFLFVVSHTTFKNSFTVYRQVFTCIRMNDRSNLLF